VFLTCGSPAWLMADELWPNPIVGDDLVYLARSRDVPRLVASLWAPHNAHVVPWFRIWTFGLVRLAGGLARLPEVFTVGAYATLVLVILACGLVVARETRSTAAGLVTMAFVGTSTVIEPALTWYSSSQSLWAGFGIVAMLLALQSWRATGGRGPLIVAILAVWLAAASWSGGYAAGPVGLAYLAADGRRRCLRAAPLPLTAGLVAAAAAVVLSGQGPLSKANFHERSVLQAASPVRGALYTCQAIPEGLVFGNLGLDVPVAGVQGVIFTLALVALWAWTARGRRPAPLEAAGATLIVVAAMLAYTFRSYLPFESLRSIWVYFALPHIGLVLFAAGWWSARRGSIPGPPRPPTRGQALAVVALLLILLVTHRSRAQRLVIVASSPLTPAERPTFTTQAARRDRGVALNRELLERQRRYLTRMQEAERVAARLGIDREAIRGEFGPILGPGWPEGVGDFDVTDVLILPPRGRPADPAAVRSALGPLLVPEAEPRPPWLDPGAPWPPRARR
jgi:hypothetical protein